MEEPQLPSRGFWGLEQGATHSGGTTLFSPGDTPSSLGCGDGLCCSPTRPLPRGSCQCAGTGPGIAAPTAGWGTPTQVPGNSPPLPVCVSLRTHHLPLHAPVSLSLSPWRAHAGPGGGLRALHLWGLVLACGADTPHLAPPQPLPGDTWHTGNTSSHLEVPPLPRGRLPRVGVHGVPLCSLRAGSVRSSCPGQVGAMHRKAGGGT